LYLEWSAFLIGLLTVSSMPASYHFTLLILPVALMVAILIEERRFVFLAVLVATYIGIGFPFWKTDLSGALAFLGVPRLYLMICLCLYSWILLWQQEQSAFQSPLGRRAWAVVLACLIVLGVGVNYRHLHAVPNRESDRILPLPTAFLATQPVTTSASEFFVSMLQDGYRAARINSNGVLLNTESADQLALAAVGNQVWVEESTRESRILSVGPDLSTRRLEIDNAEFPVASRDGGWLAYLRSEHGRSRIWLHALGQTVIDRPFSPPGFNVLEMSFFPNNKIVFAGAEDRHPPSLFLADGDRQLEQITRGEDRFPSVSPDGQWLAYSRQSSGVWNLWLKNMQTGEERRITRADCNDVSPSWGADSKTLLFASDCERGFGLTALYRRRVLP
jgi:hypothetical protein